MISRLAKLLGIVSALLIVEPALANEALIYDANGNIQSRALPGGTTQYGYDDLDRLTSETGPAKSQSLTYDANDNRLSDGTGSKTYTANTNKLASANGQTVALDQVGNITQIRGFTLDWNQAGQLKTVKQGSTLLATYYYDYRGRRSRKVTPTETTIYIYDFADHLLGEFNGSGSPLRTYIWRDDIPVAVILHGSPEKVLYLETDHLNTPIAARDENAKLVWKWESDAFGSTLPNEDPDADGVKTTINLRFPGQYYDKESGFHYNHHRYYDPQTGRYLSSDPIGLAGGPNTYGYVRANPLSLIDPSGLFEISVNDSGGRNGPTYGGTITVTGDNGQTVTAPASTWPNPSNPNPGITGGTYEGTYSPTGHQGRTDGVRVNNGGPVPTLGPNPAQGGQSFAKGINIHCGYRGNRRGSAGCVTLDPAYCKQVWDILQPGEKGTITIRRGE